MRMGDAQKLVRQWLETDRAMGVSEVPIAAGRRAASRPAPAVVKPVVKPVSPNPQVASAVRAAPPAAPAFSPGAALPPAVKSSPVRKVAAPEPLTPAGKIADLPPITRAQKEKALRALYEEFERDSASCINDISTRIVFGEGDPDAGLMFVGEGPGAEEDRTGRPFVGRSGQLLDKMIAAIGLKREQVYIANVVKLRCAEWVDGAYGRRLQDRPPTPEEAARGLPYLHQQIEIIRPKVIVTLGAPAVRHLTGTTEGVMKIRGHWLEYRGVPVMPTYHPSFVLRAYTEENRRKVWSDLKEAAKRIG